MNIEQFLKKIPKEKIYYKPNPGNGGDALIAYATIKLLDKLGLDYEMASEEVDLEDKILLYGGGGNLVNYYSTASDYLTKVYSRLKQLIILPHTIFDNDVLLKSFGQNVTIFCRERRSFDYVSDCTNLSAVFLAHDLALSLDPSEILGVYKDEWIVRKFCSSIV